MQHLMAYWSGEQDSSKPFWCRLHMGLSCKGNHSTPEISWIAALSCNSLGVEITAMSDDNSPDLAHKIQALLPPRHILLCYQLLSRFFLDNITSSNSSLTYTSFSNSLKLLYNILKLSNPSNSNTDYKSHGTVLSRTLSCILGSSSSF